MKFTCGCELRNDGTFSEYCAMHAKETELEQEVWHLQANNEWQEREITRLRAEVERRGEMLRRARQHIPRAIDEYHKIMDAWPQSDMRNSILDCQTLCQEIESLDHAPAQQQRGTDDADG